MFECIVGGVSWDEVVGPLIRDVSPVLGLLFCMYITMSLFAMMNLVTGVFVESVTKTVREDKDSTMAMRISELFMDETNPSKEICWEEFSRKMDMGTVMHDYFKTLD